MLHKTVKFPSSPSTSKKNRGGGAYGFIKLNSKYLPGEDGKAVEVQADFVKPNPQEREAIIYNHIKANSGKQISVPKIARSLAVTDRTVQTTLTRLEREGYIVRTACFTDGGKRQCNIISCTDKPYLRRTEEITFSEIYGADVASDNMDNSN